MTPAERLADRVETLKGKARAQCHGCRVSWRLDGWLHREVPGSNCGRLPCMAVAARQELRDIAKAVRK